jgi:hypothetical protein
MHNIKQFETGAVRSKDADDERYDLITPIGLRRLARTYAEGAKKYGDHNWLKGIPASDLLNHAIRHLVLWSLGDTSEDHLAHAAWNIFSLMHFEETRPSLIDIVYRGSDGFPKIVVEIDASVIHPTTTSEMF